MKISGSKGTIDIKRQAAVQCGVTANNFQHYYTVQCMVLSYTSTVVYTHSESCPTGLSALQVLSLQPQPLTDLNLALVSSMASEHAPPEPVDESILSSRLGYEREPAHEYIIPCANDAEREHLLRLQRRYRQTPDLILTRLREAREQMRVLGPSYANFTSTQQQEFVRDVEAEMAQLGLVLAEVRGQPRPALSPRGKKIKDARNGAVLQMVEAATLGMPLEVWKTRMGRFRNESTVEAFRNVHVSGGGGLTGLRAFWAGTSAKMVESASKGAVLMFSKEMLRDMCLGMQVSPTMSGFIAGAGGGVCQVSVMGPCTFLVTSVVTGDKNTSMLQHLRRTWASKGIAGFYPGGVAIAFRQVRTTVRLWRLPQEEESWKRGMLDMASILHVLP